MTPSRLSALLSRFPHTTIAVVGDFFLDKYLEIDQALAEVSLETGLEARQVRTMRSRRGSTRGFALLGGVGGSLSGTTPTRALYITAPSENTSLRSSVRLTWISCSGDM